MTGLHRGGGEGSSSRQVPRVDHDPVERWLRTAMQAMVVLMIIAMLALVFVTWGPKRGDADVGGAAAGPEGGGVPP